MRRSKEIMVLLALFIIMATGTLWYVIDRRAKNRAPAPVAARPLPAEPLVVVPQPVDLTKHEGQTIDFSSGQAVVKQTPEDKAALEAGLRDIEEAKQGVTFEAAKPAAEPKK